jgi:hypothetical protein
MKKLKARSSKLKVSTSFQAPRRPSACPLVGSFSLESVLNFELLILSLALLLLAQPSTLHSQPAQAPNRVLHLDGQGAHVDLPDDMFKSLDEATVECWIRFEKFNRDTRVFAFGDRGHEMYLANNSHTADLKCLITDTRLTRYRIEVGGAWPLGQWCHVAVVTGRRGFELYLNGTLLGTNAFTGREELLAEVRIVLGT